MGACSTGSIPSTSSCPRRRVCCACSGSHERRRGDPRVHRLDRLLHPARPGTPARALPSGRADGPFQCGAARAPGGRMAAGVCGAGQFGEGGRGKGPRAGMPRGSRHAPGRAHRRERRRWGGGARGALPVRARLRGGRGRRTPPIGGPRVRGVRGRVSARAGRVPHDGAADSLRADAPGARAGRGHPALRSGRRGQPHLRSRRRGALSRVPPRPRRGHRRRHGPYRLQCRQRDRRRAVPRGRDSLRPDRPDDRPRAGHDGAHRRGLARGRARGRHRRPPAGPGGRVLLTPISLIVVVGVLIFVHEAGHFAAAKAVGIQVLRFSLGFGRPILAWRRGETEYWISWIPFGGYVKMAGFEDEGVAGDLEGGKSAQPIDPARAFDRRPLWARSIVILAGVTMNAVFAVVVYTGLAYTGTLEPNNIATTRVDSVMVNDLPPAAQALGALRRGDRITTVNGDSVRTWGDLQLKLANAPPPVTLRVAGRPDSVVLHIAQGDTAARVATVLALSPYLEPVISSVTSGGAGAKAGLMPGDRILKVNGG